MLNSKGLHVSNVALPPFQFVEIFGEVYCAHKRMLFLCGVLV